eukprot:CAMPEP_0173275374 /NCGR_PEP_ID=MMETSP1143-20121109/2946_1 /TAXON_ID=483371 /ORGANISM="non described non described, Strain CCMP2298" /LENGTH=66 /DNA_ID=CAMNT_0014212261 /DNA_START=730 /DNA_END=930 /DNA_ORIENTATION=-
MTTSAAAFMPSDWIRLLIVSSLLALPLKCSVVPLKVWTASPANEAPSQYRTYTVFQSCIMGFIMAD